MTDLASLVVRMQADNSQYVKALEQATTRLHKFQEDQEEAFASIAETIGEAFAVDKILEFTAGSIEGAASLEKLSQAAGVSVENLGGLNLAFAASGLSQDDLSTSLKKLNVNLSDAAGNATSKSGEAFRALGISVTDSNGKIKDAGTVMGEVAEKFKDLADGPNKTALAVQLFGKAGQQLIPTLNEGKEGLDQFQKQAEAAGITLSGPAAEAAEKFEQQFAIMKATLSTGFGNQLESQLVPVLTEIGNQLTSSTAAGSAFADVAGVIVGGVKVVASVVLEAANEFKELGNSIGALSAVAVSVAHGNFSEAATIWKSSSEDNVANAAKTNAQITAIFKAGTEERKEVAEGSKDAKPDAPSLAGLAEYDAGIKKLTEFNDSLKSEAGAFGLGSAALVNYKLQFGPLSEALQKAGADGQKLATQIRANAAILQSKQDTKSITEYSNKIQEQIDKYQIGDVAAVRYATSTGEIGKSLDRMGAAGEADRAKIIALTQALTFAKDQDALVHVDQQLQTLQGHLVSAASAAFDFQNKLLIKNLGDTGDSAGQAKIAQLKATEVAQAAYNEEVQRGADIERAYATVAANVALEESAGTLSTRAGMEKLATARDAEIAQLTQVYDAEKRIADQNAITMPQLTRDTQTFANTLTELKTKTNELENSVRTTLEGAFANNFSDLITGSKTLKQAITSMATSIEKDFANIISKDLAENLFGAGGSGNSAVTGLTGLLGAFIGTGSTSSIAATGAAATGTSTDDLLTEIAAGFAGGAHAAGGTIDAGKVGLVGEQGPELVYSGAKDMQVIPNSQMSGKSTNVVNHFTVQSQNGTISRQSQMQVAAAAARSLSSASRRNN